MCLYLKAGQEPEILKEDLIVYKYGKVRNEVFTPIWKTGFQYFPGELTEKVELVSIVNELYNPKSKEDIINQGIFTSEKSVETGYHSYINQPKDEARSMFKYLGKSRQIKGGYKRYAFTIPKGSEIYRNFDNTEIVSNQIIWNG